VKKPIANKKRVKTSDIDAKLAEKLRYMNPENLAADFTGKSERAAISAVFKWMSFNMVCAVTKKNGCADPNFKVDWLGKVDSYILSDEQYERAQRALGLK
jgi:hypothetical protein